MICQEVAEFPKDYVMAKHSLLFISIHSTAVTLRLFTATLRRKQPKYEMTRTIARDGGHRVRGSYGRKNICNIHLSE